MIFKTDNETIIKIYEFYKFLKYYNKYLNEWSYNNDLDNLEESYKILFDNIFKYKLNCAKGWSQKNIFETNEYILDYINPDLYDEYKKRYKIVNNMKMEHDNVVVFGIMYKNRLNKLCLSRNIFESYIKFLKKGIIILIKYEENKNDNI
jgi:hypothetical protein